MPPLSHPDPIREIAASRAREAARIANLGTFQGERKMAAAPLPWSRRASSIVMIVAMLSMLFAGALAYRQVVLMERHVAAQERV